MKLFNKTVNGSFVLSVLTGPNAGASVALPAGHYQLGADSENDIVLAGLQPEAMEMRLNGATAVLTARSDGAQLCRSGKKSALSVGRNLSVNLPATLRLAPEVMLQVASAVDQAPVWRRAQWIGYAAALTAGCWLGANVLAGAGGGGMARAVTDMPDTPEIAAAVATTSPRMSCDSACVDNGARVLNERIAAAGLNGLTLKKEAGILRLSGAILPDQFDTWRLIRTGFEAEFGRSLPLVATIEAGEAKPILAVSSIWLGSTPEVRTKGGNVFHIGDSTNDGWIIRSIEKGKIGLERADQQAEVRF